MEKRYRILYLKDPDSKNTEFINYLKKYYRTNVFNFVLPDILYARFGHMNFSTLKEVDDLDWDEAIKNINSMDDITYDYGLDFFSDDTNSRSFIFRHCLIKYFDSLNFKFNEKTKISKIVSSIKTSKTFIRENKIFNYDLIIIENLASMNITQAKTNIRNPYLNDDNWPQFIQYKITPRLLNKVLNSNSKLLLLMDYDSTSFVLGNEFLSRYKKIMERVGICSFRLADNSIDENFDKYTDLLVGIDFENRINDTLCEFNITVNEDYKKNIVEKNLPFYRDVNNIFVDFPVQLNTESKNNIPGSSKIILTGNDDTTKLYPGWDNEIYETIKRNEIVLNIERIKDSEKLKQISTWDEKTAKLKEFKDIRKLKELKHLEDFDYYKMNSANYPYVNIPAKSKPVFCISDKLYNSAYIILSGHLCGDNFFVNRQCGNNTFIRNLIDFFTVQTQIGTNSNIEFLPKIKIYIETGEITIDGIQIPLSNMEFCYFRFFSERAKDNRGFTSIAEDIHSIYNKGDLSSYADLKISSAIIEKIIGYYRESFPEYKFITKLENMFYKEKRTPKISETFNRNISKIKKKISLRTKIILTDNQLDKVIISHFGNGEFAKYGISLPPDNIEII